MGGCKLMDGGKGNFLGDKLMDGWLTELVDAKVNG